MSFNEMNEKCVKLKRKHNHIFENVMFLGSHLFFLFRLFSPETYGSFYLDLTGISGIIGVAGAVPVKLLFRIPFCFDVIYFYSSFFVLLNI